MEPEDQPEPMDCYARKLPGEPYFTLLARDPAAPLAVLDWLAHRKQEDKMTPEERDYAFKLADAMTEWRLANQGAWQAQGELPLAPPPRPVVFGDTVMRVALVPDADPSNPVALTANFEGEDKVIADAKLVKGRLEIAFTDGFGKSRSLQLSPAEYLLLLLYGSRFFGELAK